MLSSFATPAGAGGPRAVQTPAPGTIDRITSNTRHVEFEACFNFRDLGGYPTSDGRSVRWGLLYRSDTLHRLTTADAETLRSLGLRTVVDMRSTTEIDDHGRLDVGHGDFTWHNVPILDGVKLAPRDPNDPAPAPQPMAPGEGYYTIVKEFGRSLAEVFSLLSADDALPAVFHCTSGKDRTGIVAALLLDFLGAPDDVIVTDYVLTEAVRERSTTWIEANEPAFAAFLAEIPPERRAATPEKILGFLGLVRSEYGSVERFLVGLGVDRARLGRLRDRLLTT